jgi:cell division inhibitor SepF
MGALQKLKAYFGMVPADEVDGYDDGDTFGSRYGSERVAYATDYRGDYRQDSGPDYSAGHSTYGQGGQGNSFQQYEGEEFDDYPARGRRRLFGGTRAGYRPEAADEADDFTDRARPRRPWAEQAPTRGALAVEPEPLPRVRTVTQETPAPTTNPFGRITTLHPTTYNEARAIGEAYREGTSVIINLTAMADSDAKRLVDFAAGLAFARRGSIDKVTNKVFLLSPPNVDVSAEDRKRIAEGGFFG